MPQPVRRRRWKIVAFVVGGWIAVGAVFNLLGSHGSGCVNGTVLRSDVATVNALENGVAGDVNARDFARASADLRQMGSTFDRMSVSVKADAALASKLQVAATDARSAADAVDAGNGPAAASAVGAINSDIQAIKTAASSSTLDVCSGT